jgi:hypothetical protein
LEEEIGGLALFGLGFLPGSAGGLIDEPRLKGAPWRPGGGLEAVLAGGGKVGREAAAEVLSVDSQQEGLLPEVVVPVVQDLCDGQSAKVTVGGWRRGSREGLNADDAGDLVLELPQGGAVHLADGCFQLSLIGMGSGIVDIYYQGCVDGHQEFVPSGEEVRGMGRERGRRGLVLSTVQGEVAQG